FPYARTDWDRPNSTQTLTCSSTIRSNLINEATYTHSLDQVFINVFTGTDLFRRSRTGINYPYVFPANKEIPDRVPTISIGLFSNYAEIGQRAFTPWRSVGTDVFVQDSWRPASNLTIEGGVRWVIWPPWHSQTNNIANFEPQFYSTANAAIVDRSTGRIIGGPRY